MIRQSKEHYRSAKPNNNSSYPMSTQRSILQLHSIRQLQPRSTMRVDKQIRNNSQQMIFKSKQINTPSTSQYQFKNCKICGRKNHRTIDCFHKGQTHVSIVVKTIPFVNAQCFQIFSNWVT